MEMVKQGFTRQTLTAMAMFRQIIERCPDEVWVSGAHPRTFWRIAYHGAYYAHLYLYPNVASYKAWSKHRAGAGQLDGKPKVMEPYTRQELIEFADLIIAEAPAAIASMDFTAQDCGYDWYPNLPKIDHQILSLRHLHGHMGQLSEILLAHGIETDWMGQL